MRTVCSKHRIAKYRALVLMLCASMLFGAIFTSCNSESDLSNSSENSSADQTVTVFRVVKDIPAGAKITTGKLEEVALPKVQTAIGAISDPDLFSGKYAAINLEEGDILIQEYISDEPVHNKADVTLDKKNFGFKDLGYTVVTDYVTPNLGNDLADELQTIFDMKASVNKVIYFPEGEYIISKPLKTSANGGSSISIKLSPNAIIKAADNWDTTNGAMIQLGEKNKINNIDIIGSNYYIEGGIIDGNGEADGIALNGGRETSIRNLSVINTDTGVFWNKLGQVADSDLENVTIIGNGKIGSIGIRIEGSDSTFTNMRISNVQTGVLVNAPAHIFRNIYVTYIPNPILDTVYDSSYGFRSEDHRCWFDTCVSEGFSTAFSLSRRGDTLASCVASWENVYGTGRQVAISATYGKYNGVSRSVAAYFSGPKQKCEYLVAPNGGSGTIYDPIFDESAVNSLLYKEYLRTSARTTASE